MSEEKRRAGGVLWELVSFWTILILIVGGIFERERTKRLREGGDDDRRS